MALVKCPTCANDVSSAAASCPACGHPLAEDPMPTREQWAKTKRDVTLLQATVIALLITSFACIIAGSKLWVAAHETESTLTKCMGLVRELQGPIKGSP